VKFSLLQGDCRQVLATLAADSIDSVVTDPPYGLSFMGKEWDHGVPGAPFWQEILRVAKPGAFLLAFGGTRTFHRLTCAIEDAGWEIRDCIMWVYSSGFPKSLDISKALDKAAGATRTEVIGQYQPPQMDKPWNLTNAADERNVEMFSSSRNNLDILAPVTDSAKQWNGWGTALKPAWEPIIVARKPLDGTTVKNILTHGTGGLNINESRVPIDPEADASQLRTINRNARTEDTSGQQWGLTKNEGDKPTVVHSSGRWPANLIHDGSDEVVELFPVTHSGAMKRTVEAYDGESQTGFLRGRSGPSNQHGDSGSAARFFYCTKATKKERDEGLETFPTQTADPYAQHRGRRMPEGSERFDGKPAATGKNTHPTVKPVKLMTYLCKLVTPPGGTVLDPFMGSGSTGRAAAQANFSFVGIDNDEEAFRIAEARVSAAYAGNLTTK
jgi:site-specific DNA-methyltransferase (adenine-specific)